MFGLPIIAIDIYEIAMLALGVCALAGLGYVAFRVIKNVIKRRKERKIMKRALPPAKEKQKLPPAKQKEKENEDDKVVYALPPHKQKKPIKSIKTISKLGKQFKSTYSGDRIFARAMEDADDMLTHGGKSLKIVLAHGTQSEDALCTIVFDLLPKAKAKSGKKANQTQSVRASQVDEIKNILADIQRAQNINDYVTLDNILAITQGYDKDFCKVYEGGESKVKSGKNLREDYKPHYCSGSLIAPVEETKLNPEETKAEEKPTEETPKRAVKVTGKEFAEDKQTVVLQGVHESNEDYAQSTKITKTPSDVDKMVADLKAMLKKEEEVSPELV